MKPLKKVDFLKYRFLNRFKNDIEQRKLLVGEPLFSFIHFVMVNIVKNDNILNSFIFPEFLFEDGKKFSTLDSEYVTGSVVCEYFTPQKFIEYKILETPTNKFKVQQGQNVCDLLYFVKDGDHIELFPKITELTTDSTFSFLRAGKKEFIHDDKTGVYYPFRKIKIKI